MNSWEGYKQGEKLLQKFENAEASGGGIVKLIRGFEDKNLFSFAHGVCAAGPPPSGV